MSTQAIKAKLEQIVQKPPVAKDILSMVQSFRKSGVAGLQKHIQKFARKDNTKNSKSKFKKSLNRTVSRSRASRNASRSHASRRA